MHNLNLFIFFSVLLSFTSLVILRYFASSLGLVDMPCNRKRHVGHIPLIGGMSIFISMCISISVFIENTQYINLFLIACSLMVFIGVLDDKYDLTVRSRLIGQFLISAILIFGVGSYIESLGNIFHQGVIHLGMFGIPLTFIAIIAAINSFNMLDGIDGLLASCAAVAFSGLTFCFYDHGDVNNYLICIGIIFSLLPFLLANFGAFPFKSGKTFMGDAGSMFIGLAVAWFLISGSQTHLLTGPAFKPVIALYIISLPLMDMILVIIRRLKAGKSPMKPGRDHAHHLLMKYGLSPKQTLLMLTISYLFMMVAGLALESILLEYQLFIIFFIFFSIYSLSMQYIEKRGK